VPRTIRMMYIKKYPKSKVWIFAIINNHPVNLFDEG